ncbi:hypothetical protein Tco_0958407, partial [Tanacetum coccineum]
WVKFDCDVCYLLSSGSPAFWDFRIEAVRFQWASDEEPDAPAEAPPSPDYVLGPEHQPSPDYVPEPEYPEYLAPSDAKAPMEDQPLLDDASPTALSPGYVADFDPEEDPEEDPKEDPVYEGDDADDESSDDDDNDDDEEQESSEDDDEEEEHLTLADSSVVPVVDLVSSAEDT